MGSLGSRTISEGPSKQVDAEVRRIIDEQYKVARDIPWKITKILPMPW